LHPVVDVLINTNKEIVNKVIRGKAILDEGITSHATKIMSVSATTASTVNSVPAQITSSNLDVAFSEIAELCSLNAFQVNFDFNKNENKSIKGLFDRIVLVTFAPSILSVEKYDIGRWMYVNYLQGKQADINNRVSTFQICSFRHEETEIRFAEANLEAGRFDRTFESYLQDIGSNWTIDADYEYYIDEDQYDPVRDFFQFMLEEPTLYQIPDENDSIVSRIETMNVSSLYPFRYGQTYTNNGAVVTRRRRPACGLVEAIGFLRVLAMVQMKNGETRDANSMNRFADLLYNYRDNIEHNIINLCKFSPLRRLSMKYIRRTSTMNMTSYDPRKLYSFMNGKTGEIKFGKELYIYNQKMSDLTHDMELVNKISTSVDKFIKDKPMSKRVEIKEKLASIIEDWFCLNGTEEIRRAMFRQNTLPVNLHGALNEAIDSAFVNVQRKYHYLRIVNKVKITKFNEGFKDKVGFVNYKNRNDVVNTKITEYDDGDIIPWDSDTLRVYRTLRNEGKWVRVPFTKVNIIFTDGYKSITNMTSEGTVDQNNPYNDSKVLNYLVDGSLSEGKMLPINAVAYLGSTTPLNTPLDMFKPLVSPASQDVDNMILKINADFFIYGS
jgi:hypothetical protein